MTRIVRWSALALDELDRIGDYISQDNPDAADAMLDRIEAAAEKLGRMATGHPGRVNGIYEKLVPRSRYIIAYEIADYGGDEAIVILRVIHTSRNWHEESWPE